jgi:CD2 antigen cytoplasmic tail-binding protein 2
MPQAFQLLVSIRQAKRSFHTHVKRHNTITMAQPTSAARPKRAAEDYVRQNDNTNKKPRFDYRNPSTLAADEPEDDIILNADVIGKSGAQVKRNAVNIDGYESDSDNDNFNARAAERERSKKASEKKSQDEEEDDMFADLEQADGDEDEEKAAEGKKSKKDVRFVNPEDIVEGQVMDSTPGGHVSAELLKGKRRSRKQDDSESSSGEEEDRDQLPDEMEEDLAAEIGAGGKKKHAPRLDAFNLKAEEEEGRYDESGNFVRKATDPDAVNDSWLDGLTRKDMKRAREAQEKRDDEQRRKAAESDAQLTSDILSTLIQHLETGETPLEALQRLNKGKRVKEAKVPKWKQKKLQKDKMEIDEATNGHETATLDPTEEARRTAISSITSSADALYSREQHEIYDTEREMLLRQYRRETGEDWVAPAQPVADDQGGQTNGEATFEYRWSDARDGGEVHGPYDGATMTAWNDAGYFGEGVEFRRIDGGEWGRVLDVQ